MSPQQRLEQILWQEELCAFATFSGGPAVCCTEASPSGLEFLIRQRNYAPWGLVFDRQRVYGAGGAPVWYARPEQYERLEQAGLAHWAVRLDPGSDWLEEREWRIPRPVGPSGDIPTVLLSELGLCGVIVGDRTWDGVVVEPEPSLCNKPDVLGTLPEHWVPRHPPALVGLPRCWWDPDEKRLVPLGE